MKIDEPLKVLHINQSDIAGGASVSGYRLHNGLLSHGVDSCLLVGSKETDDESVLQFNKPNYLERASGRITRALGLNYINFRTRPFLEKKYEYKTADIVNLHNLHGGYFNYLAISRISQARPTVLTLHDIWSFTGHCGYNLNYSCSRWKTGCGKCPSLDLYPSVKRDSTRIEWYLKSREYRKSNIHVVSPSVWLTQQARNSILGHLPIHWIPHGIDTSTFCPMSLEECRKLLGISTEKKILMIASNDVNAKHKGGDLLVNALSQLPHSLKNDLLLLCMGNNSELIASKVGISSVSLGYLSEEKLKAAAYNLADLFLHPTRADIFGLVLQESMACGTPMVSFDVGGVPDLVRPGETGYLAKTEDTQDFCQGIIQLLEDSAQRQHMAQRCREIALSEYPIELQAKRYIELYQTLLVKKQFTPVASTVAAPG